MNWYKYSSYSVFDEFIEIFILSGKSYVTTHHKPLNFLDGFAEIRHCYVENYDDTKNKDFGDKLGDQFSDASENAKIIFANIEYLWAMSVSSITSKTKREYALRWFANEQVVSGDQFYFNDSNTIANPGEWHARNKFYEIVTLFELLSFLIPTYQGADLKEAKKIIEDACYKAIYKPKALTFNLVQPKQCAMHHILLHLANPSKYEIIVSDTDKDNIIRVFGYLLDGEGVSDRENSITIIKNKLYDSNAISATEDDKFRWFFYMPEVKKIWKGKNATECSSSSIQHQIDSEEGAGSLEGGTGKKKTTNIILRDAKLVRAVKERDNYTCKSCSFHFQKKVVHAHHLDPLSERKNPEITREDDLITLCPTCHFLAHYLLNRSSAYKQEKTLLKKLKSINIRPNT